MNLGPAEPRYDTIVDSALFHIFDDTDRPRYVASLHTACRPGGAGACAGAVRHGPRIRARGQRRARSGTAFSDGWELEALEATTYRGVVTEVAARRRSGCRSGPRVDEPA